VVDQAKLFTRCSSSAPFWQAWAGAANPREPANLELDLAVIADAFVVTVVAAGQHRRRFLAPC